MVHASCVTVRMSEGIAGWNALAANVSRYVCKLSAAQMIEK
jgi:hypothetical protein